MLVAGAHSPDGGSALLLDACRIGGFKAQSSFVVLLETLRALKGLPPESLRCFYQLLTEIDWELLPIPSENIMHKYERYVAAKDVHVLAAAAEGQAEFLLTLDRRHLLTAAQAIKGTGWSIVILRPGDFIREYYVQHEDYPSLPSVRSR